MYVRNDVEVVCRFDFELFIIEFFWIEVCLLKFYSFLVGVFYRLFIVLNYVVKDYMFIFESGL